MGIRKEDLDRVFEPFTIIKKPTYVRGTGLGLSISKHLVEAHGGRIWLESEEGMGSCFHP
jgi:signal transduction histidine kinase